MVVEAAPTAVTLTPEGAQAKFEDDRDTLRQSARDAIWHPDRLRPLFLDLLVTAGIAAALFLFLIALKTEIAIGGLVIHQHWIDWLFAILVVVLGRLVLLAIWQRPAPDALGGAIAAGLAIAYVALAIADSPRRLWLLALAIAALFGLARSARFPGAGLVGLLLLAPPVLYLVGLFVPAIETTVTGGGAAIGLSGDDLLLLLLGLAIVGVALLLPREADSAAGERFVAAGDTLGRFVAPALLLVAFAWPLMFSGNRYILDLSILVLTYVMLGWGLNIVVGLAGLLDLGYVAFYAVGAYSFALLARYLDLGFWTALPLAGLLAALWGMVLGFPVLRLRGDYLAIVTLAFGEIIRVVLINWSDFTGGPNGLLNIPKPTLFGLDFTNGENGFAKFFDIPYASTQRFIFLYYIILGLALITCLVTIRLKRLPIGRAWEALREDEIACRSLGINTRNTKLTAFALGAMFGGFAGSFFATRQGFISPESFTFIESALILAIVVLGGLGSQLGVVIAAVVMIGGFEVFRQYAEYRMLIFGIAMILIMIWRPRGLVSSRMPSASLKERKAIGSDMVAQGEGH